MRVVTLNETMQLAKTAANELRTTLDDMPARIAALMDERKKLERELSEAKKTIAMGGGAAAVHRPLAARPQTSRRSATSS